MMARRGAPKHRNQTGNSPAVQRQLDQTRIAALQAIQQTMLGSPLASASAAIPETTADSGRWAWARRPRDADSDTLPYLKGHRGQSRWLAQHSAIGVGAIRTNVDRVVGTGLALSANPAANVLGWNAGQAAYFKTVVQSEFSLWADGTGCDYAAKQNFYELQASVLWGMLASGDIFSLLPNEAVTATNPYELRIQLIEADRCGNPMGQADTDAIAGGIRFANGKPTAAHIYDRHPGAGYVAGSSLYSGNWIDFVGQSGRRRLLHHMRSHRGQPRGVPYLTPVVNDIKRLGDYADAEIKAAVVSAYYTVFIETPTGDTSQVHGAGTPEANGNETFDLSAAAVIGLAPGEKISTSNPGRPNPNFDAFMTAVAGHIGMGLGLPRELLLKQFNASYSASKAALLDAWIYFRGVRTWLARSFCQPVYETWMAEAVIQGRIKAPGFFADPLLRWAYTRASWPGDSMGSINPKDEVAAYSAAVDARMVSRERAEWELFGTDWHETFAAKKTEQDMLKAADMLPVPKAGAAAPATATTATETGTTP